MSQVLKPKKGYKKVKWLFGQEIKIPEEWKLVNVEYVADKLVSGGTPSTFVSEYWEGDIAWTKGATLITQYTTKGERLISKAGLKNSSTLIIPKNNLLIVSRVSIGNLSINKIDIAINQDITAIILNKSLCSTKFLYWNLLNSISILVLFSQGTTIQGFTRKDLSNHKVLLPSFPEQQKIASILSNIDNLINSTQKVIDQNKSLKQGLMQKLFTKGIRHKKFKKTKWLFRKEIEIPEDWEVKQLDDILKIVQYGISKPMFKEGKYPIFRMNSIQKSKVIESDMKFIDLTTEEFKKYKLEKEDLLFNRTNSYNLVGKIGIFLLEGNFTFAGYLIRLRTNEKMNPIFLNNYLNTKSSRYNVKRFATPAVSQTNINAENLKSVIITVPPRQEQDKIAIILSNIDSQIQSQIQYKEKLEKLKKSLMQKLLIGEIRVKV